MSNAQQDQRPADQEIIGAGRAMPSTLEAETGPAGQTGAGIRFLPQDLFVSPGGRDHWSGRLPAPNAAGTDGPLATISRARDLIRERKGLGSAEWNHSVVYQELDLPMTVWVRGGEYCLTEPLTFDERDAGPICYRAYPGETPILTGSRRITHWRQGEVNGRDAWIAELPEVARGAWHFRQLFVGGERRLRASPNGAREVENLYRMAEVPGIDPTDISHAGRAFICRPGDIQPWRNLQDVEIVVIHYWIEERTPLRSFDPATNRVEMQRKSRMFLMDSYRGETRKFAPYYVENVFEALTDPGEWYLDRADGLLYYLPLPGETPETTVVTAPVTLQLLCITGKPEENRFVEHLTFDGLVFQETDWRYPGEEGLPIAGVRISHEANAADRGADTAGAAQASCDVPGALRLEGARYCTFRNCTARNIGWYGIELADGCFGNTLAHNVLADLGGGGIKVNGATSAGPRCRHTGRNRITDNRVCRAGRVFHSAVGILLMHSFANRVAHNHIHDILYSGISCGWDWTYGETVSRDNILEKNHIHDIGNGLLDDIGGIYTLGVQSGTVVRGNLIHDVRHRNYGARLIYLDACSSHIVVENNICWHSSQEVLLHQSGRENIVRNNIFLLARGKGQIGCFYNKTNEHDTAMTFVRNIVITDGLPVFHHYCTGMDPLRSVYADSNLFWSLSGTDRIEIGHDTNVLSLAQWRDDYRCDRHSRIADPGFADLAQFDFTLPDDSPAFALGFRPIDMRDVGPRG